MKMLGFLVALVALALVGASAGLAHPGNWYWPRASAESYIVNKVQTSDGEDIMDASCTGIGKVWRTGGRNLWHHFRCEEDDDLDREITVIFHPVSRYHAAVVEIACDDTYSEYSCP